MTAKPSNRSFLFAHWEGGGNTPPMLSVARRLVNAGHTVRILSDACNRQEAEAAGASFTAWKRVRQRPDKSAETDPLRDWEASSPFALIAKLREHLLVGPALNYAIDVLEELKIFPADAIVTSEMLLGVMAAAEKTGIPSAALSANIYFYPLPSVPPFGPGLLPAKGALGQLRDFAIRTLSYREFGKGTKLFNIARKSLGLDPLAHPFDQLERVHRHLVLTSPAFDFPTAALPERVVYAGPELSDPDWTDSWRSPWHAADARPLVLVGFSTTFQDQAASLQRVIDALGGLDVRAVVTVGPALDLHRFRAAPNVHLCASAPHSELMKEAAVVVTHCGHGTVIRSLAAGVPMVCMPMGRDQNDNAARVVARGAGVRLSPTGGADAIRKSVQKVLRSPAYRTRAQELGARIAEDARHSTAVQILEQLAARHAPVAR